MKLNPIFTGGMVLAAYKPIRIFGQGKGRVSVSFLGYEHTLNSAGDDWLIELPPAPYGGPHTMQLSLDGEAVTLSDVYLGEVILLHGQSNIEFKMRESSSPAESYQSCELLRMFSVQNMHRGERWEQRDGWIRCRADEVGDWSAIGYHVGMELVKKKNCAVGLIACYEGASVIQSWLPDGTMDEMGLFLQASDLHRDHTSPVYSKWNGEGVLYRFMVEQLIPYSLSQVIWYQGESNASEAEGKVYHRLLARLVEQRRRDFADETLFFAVVQLADTHKRMKENNGWRLVQEAQMRVAQEMTGVATVVCRDICETDQIHPPTKGLLAHRIVEVVLNNIDQRIAGS